MRSDVEKVISERPKSGRTWEKKNPRENPVVFDSLGEPIDEPHDFNPDKAPEVSECEI